MSENGLVQLWNLDSFALLGFLGIPGTSAFSIAFSPDGATLAVGSDEGHVELWEVITGRRIQFLAGHRGPVRAIAFVPNGDVLITGGNDTTLLAWDYSLVPPEIKAQKQSIDAEGWSKLWADLADSSPLKAHTAMRILTAHGTQSMALLRSRLGPTTDADLKPMQHLVSQLDSDDFFTRQRATKDLAQLGAEAILILRHLLSANPSLELRRRIESILREPAFLRSRETIRQIRAMQVLERIGSVEARSMLERLAKGSPLAIQTAHAEAALARISNRLGKSASGQKRQR